MRYKKLQPQLRSSLHKISFFFPLMSMLVEMPQLICELESHYWEIISLHASCLLTKILAFTLVFICLLKFLSEFHKLGDSKK